MLDPSSAFCTRSIHAGTQPDPTTGAILTPIHQSTTFVQEAVGVDKGFTYSRAGNPTVAALEARLGALEDAPPAVATSSGMSALACLFFGLCSAGDRVVVGRTVYGGTVRLLRQVLARFGVEAVFIDTEDPAALDAALAREPRLVLVETPANPTLELCDIARIAAVAHDAGALCVVDNTFLTAALQRPFELGADVVVYSTTKFVEGHNATLGGALLARNPELCAAFSLARKTLGCGQSPLEAWLTLRGLATLELRVLKHSENALEVARFLEQHPAVAHVAYPGLDSFPQRALAGRQQVAGGGVLAFELVGGAAAGVALLNSVRLASLAENLGATESLITHPVSMTHGAVPREQREAAGITDGLVRLSVGLEDPRDLSADLERALASLAEPQEVSR